MYNLFYILLLILTIVIFVYVYWRFFYFFRNPDRNIPPGPNIVSPADGTVVYIKKINSDEIPISIKKKRLIKLKEIFSSVENVSEEHYLIGIFMHPTDVHVNRAPISGKVEKVVYTNSRNLPMTLMWWRILFGMKPYELYSDHVIQNERNTISFKGDFLLHIVQIADIYVNKIDCWVKEGESVEKGQRVGMIRMGSQVDVLFPSAVVSEILIKEGQKIKAGCSIIASIK